MIIHKPENHRLNDPDTVRQAVAVLPATGRLETRIHHRLEFAHLLSIHFAPCLNRAPMEEITSQGVSHLIRIPIRQASSRDVRLDGIAKRIVAEQVFVADRRRITEDRTRQSENRFINRIRGRIGGEPEHVIIVKDVPACRGEGLKFPLPEKIQPALKDHREFHFIFERAGIIPLEPAVGCAERIGIAYRREIPGSLKGLPQTVQIPVSQAIGVDEDGLVIRNQVRKTQFVQEGITRILDHDHIVELGGDSVLLVANYRERQGLWGKQAVRPQQVPGYLIIMRFPCGYSDEAACDL